MTVTIFSNFLNHHQLPLCRAMEKRLGKGFTFVATSPFNQGQVSKGYRDMNKEEEFCLCSYEGEESAKKARELALESDIVILGAAPQKYLSMRLRHPGKISFRYSERIFKPQDTSAMNPRALAGIYIDNTWYTQFLKRPLYLLCAGAYVKEDYNQAGAFKNGAYKWGYFPEYDSYATRNYSTKGPVKLLWAGRMLNWKRGEMAIQLAMDLKKCGMDIQLEMIGEGPEQENWMRLAAGESNIVFSGSKPAHEVRQAMRDSQVYLFTSDANEGWGAVLNEAMASGCAVIASRAAGATPYLIENNKNGLIFSNMDEYLSLGKQLVNSPKQMQELGYQAAKTIQTTWNAENAADNLLALCESLLANKTQPVVKSGPCSLA